MKTQLTILRAIPSEASELISSVPRPPHPTGMFHIAIGKREFINLLEPENASAWLGVTVLSYESATIHDLLSKCTQKTVNLKWFCQEVLHTI